ncbi:hypothetical protein [Arthrobacter sp. AL12]|uniref:hypothetical protein n=1 Tax=Arthrobacter sp. AL12 TaxID=3042241 RepID=UPI00249C784D|nr:hypothetical protein [Arthrobacter sp. AL12]MDI3211768.1 hypothetical protein [Arthrobacter sp. AL12]
MYKVTLPREFPYEQRIRAGIVVNKEHGYEGELAAEQLKAIKADKVFSVERIETEAEKQTKAETAAKAAEGKTKAEADNK